MHVDCKDGFPSFTNHSCEPNAALDNDGLYAIKDIQEGEQIFFNYLTTEWDMAAAFECR